MCRSSLTFRVNCNFLDCYTLLIKALQYFEMSVPFDHEDFHLIFLRGNSETRLLEDSLFWYLYHTTHTHTHTHSSIPLNKSSSRRSVRYLPTTDEQPFPELDPSDRAAADLRLRPHGHRHRLHLPVCKYLGHYLRF